MNESEVAERLGGIEAVLQHVGNEITRLANHQQEANHRVEKLEHAAIKALGEHEERQRWQDKQVSEVRTALDKKEQKDAQRITWLIQMMAVGLTGAGLLSGITFTIMDKFVLAIL